MENCSGGVRRFAELSYLENCIFGGVKRFEVLSSCLENCSGGVRRFEVLSCLENCRRNEEV